MFSSYNFDFVPATGPLKEYEGNAIVPLFGDRSPFATSGRKLVDHIGFKVVRVDPTSREVTDFIRNAKGGPASALPNGEGLIERPIAVKFTRDGRLLILDFGQADYKSGHEKVKAHTSKLFILEPLNATTKPATSPK